MKRMEQIAPPPTAKKTVLNVAAYARISMETERTPISLSTQISYYQKLITSTPGWNFAGVFADSGISGTTTQAAAIPELLTLRGQARSTLSSPSPSPAFHATP